MLICQCGRFVQKDNGFKKNRHGPYEAQTRSHLNSKAALLLTQMSHARQSIRQNNFYVQFTVFLKW